MLAARRIVVSMVCGTAIAIVGCATGSVGNEVTGFDAGTPGTDSGKRDSATQLPPTDGGGGCGNTQTDPKNCGSCGNACGTGATCSAGKCTCTTGTLCNGACIDTQTDAGNKRCRWFA